ncbi:MAG: threonine synthase [Chlorobi bacterium]|nr:threonine synthase [Chlorobiota bacterium]
MSNLSLNKFNYICTYCNKQYGANKVTYLCPDCNKSNTPDKPPKGVLKTVYDYDGLQKAGFGFQKLSRTGFIDLLPINDLKSLPKLKTGNTPLYEFGKLDNEDLPFKLFLKDDSQNPTYSFKDRASALVSAYAGENGLDVIIAASTGNAGSSLAGICASQNQKAIIMVPETAPIAKLTQIVMYGATIVPVKGTYDDAFDLSIKATEEFGWYNRNTAFNPLTIEGKKTVSFEIFGQMGKMLPDRIFVPVGDGVIISGVYKGFEDLMNLGIIEKIPVIVAVQAKGSDNLTRNIEGKSFTIKISDTLADSISVDIPRNFYMARDYLLKYNGEWITVNDREIMDASSILSRNSGLFAEPAATTAFAGMLKYRENEKLETGSSNLVLLTGSGLKDIQVLKDIIRIPKAIEPNIKNLLHIITG